jgi:hypothetical protein
MCAFLKLAGGGWYTVSVNVSSLPVELQPGGAHALHADALKPYMAAVSDSDVCVLYHIL